MYLVAGVDYTIVMEGVPGPVGDSLNLAVYPDPVFLSIKDNDQKQTAGSVKPIRINVGTKSFTLFTINKSIFLPYLALGILHKKCCSVL